MAYKDKDKQRKTTRERVRRFRQKQRALQTDKVARWQTLDPWHKKLS